MVDPKALHLGMGVFTCAEDIHLTSRIRYGISRPRELSHSLQHRHIMSKSFEIQLQRPASQIIADAHATAQRKGVQFEGDTEKGQFSGMGLKGHYTIEGNTLQVEVTEKPLLLSWGMIETAVKGYFSG